MDWENIFKKSDKDLISRIYKWLQQFKSIKTNNLLLGWERTWMDNSPKKICKLPVIVLEDT